MSKLETTRRRVCLVTGAGKRRVGSIVAAFMAREGFDIAIHYRSSAAEASEVADELRAAGVRAECFQGDVGQENDVTRIVSEVMSSFGRIDLLVNCASTWLRKPLEETRAKDVLDEFSSNCLGTFLMSQAVGLVMTKQPEGGHIVTIGDWAIERPYLDHSAYFVSKGAIPTMTRMLAIELAAKNPNVRVNCIAPGPVMLPEGIAAGEVEAIKNATLVKRLGEPSHVAHAVSFLTQNTFMTGVVLPVDGGRSMYAPE